MNERNLRVPPVSGLGIDCEWFDWGDELLDDDDDEEFVDDDELLDWCCSTLIIKPLGFLFLRTNLPLIVR